MTRDALSPEQISTLAARVSFDPEQIKAQDDEERIEGYWDARDNAPPPGPNRSDAYVHGFWAGSRDAGRRGTHHLDQVLAKLAMEGRL